MSIASTRRLRAEELRQVTMKRSVARWWSTRTPCACHACRTLTAIREMVASGQVVQVDVGAAHLPVDVGTKH